MHQEQRLTGNEPVAAITDLAEPQFGDASAGADGVGASAPVGDAVDATDGMGAEAADRARSGSRSSAEIVGAPIGRQSDGQGIRFRSDRCRAEGDGNEEDEKERGV